MWLIILAFAVFGNMAQLQMKYDFCKNHPEEIEYCKIQHELNKEFNDEEVELFVD